MVIELFCLTLVEPAYCLFCSLCIGYLSLRYFVSTGTGEPMSSVLADANQQWDTFCRLGFLYGYVMFIIRPTDPLFLFYFTMKTVYKHWEKMIAWAVFGRGCGRHRNHGKQKKNRNTEWIVILLISVTNIFLNLIFWYRWWSHCSYICMCCSFFFRYLIPLFLL
jgi:hypothetical protein